jgi:hypothetical protein
MIYTHVLNRGGRGVRSPLDAGPGLRPPGGITPALGSPGGQSITAPDDSRRGQKPRPECEL